MEGHHGFWVQTCMVKVSGVPTVEAQLVDLTTVILQGIEMVISVKVGCFGGSGDERQDKRDGGLLLLSVLGAGRLAPTDASLSANVGSFSEGCCSLSL